MHKWRAYRRTVRVNRIYRTTVGSMSSQPAGCISAMHWMMRFAIARMRFAMCLSLSVSLSLPLSSIYPIRLLLSSIWLFAGMRRRHTRNLHIHTAYTSHNYSSPYHVHSHLSATHDLERDYINIRSVIQIFIMNLVITGITYSYMNINIWWFWRLDNNKIWVI